LTYRNIAAEIQGLQDKTLFQLVYSLRHAIYSDQLFTN
jgi:hypothetical protein